MLRSAPFARLRRRLGEALTTDLLRERLAELRDLARAGRIDRRELRAAATPAALGREVAARAERLLAPSPRGVINATGVVVHTNLGRSLLSQDAAGRVAAAATGYVDLEYDLRRGERGSRSDHLRPLLARLFPGHHSLAVNNNAAAILLALRALARGKEVIVSRGELVEIGGSFRVPDILKVSGARLREVGTTNRTRITDYQRALGPKTGLLLKVHTSNFRIVGFAEETPLPRLAKLARQAGVPLVVDWGSGDLVDLTPLGVRDEKPVRRILDEGADLVTFSGDKLLGGPQAGILVGDRALIERVERDPLARAVRLDRLRIAALRETLVAYVTGREFEEVPTLRMLALDPKEVGRRAERMRRAVTRATGIRGRMRLTEGTSRTGGGSSPAGERPTRLLAVRAEDGDAAPLERALRAGEPPVIGRIHEGELYLDLRTVPAEQDEALAGRLAAVLNQQGG